MTVREMVFQLPPDAGKNPKAEVALAGKAVGAKLIRQPDRVRLVLDKPIKLQAGKEGPAAIEITLSY
jgi:hypothetical protein